MLGRAREFVASAAMDGRGWPKRVSAWAAIVCAVVITFGLRAFRLDVSWDIFIDEIFYLRISRNVLQSFWVLGEDGPFYLHPPGFFFVEAAYIKLAGIGGGLIHQIHDVRYLVAAFAGLSAGALLWSGRSLAGWPAGVAACALFALDPFSIKLNSLNMLDTPTLFWVLLGYAVLFSALTREDHRPISWRRTVLAGFLFGLAILTKEVGVFITLLPLGICFVAGWALPRTRSALAGSVAVITYAPYPVAVYAIGDWGDFVYQKFNGISRMAGLLQITGFNQQGGPSFFDAIVSRLEENATTYVLLATGAAAVCVLLVTDAGKAPARRLLVAWTSSAYAFLAYAMVFGTLEEQYFYYLVPPAILATTVAIALLLQRTKSGAVGKRSVRTAWSARNGRCWQWAPKVVVAVFMGALVLWDTHSWATVHTVPNNGYQRVLSFVEELPEGDRVAVTDETQDLLIREHVGGRMYKSVEALRDDNIDYLIVNSDLATEGYERPPPDVYRWVKDNSRLAYGFESSRSSELIGVWRLGGSDASETAASGDATKAPVASPNGAPDTPSAGDAGCEGDDYLCIRERVAEIAPEAEYLGGRIDVETGGPAPNRYVLFFEDPATETCEFRRLEQVSEGTHTYYVAVVAGKGSYGRDCVAEAGQ